MRKMPGEKLKDEKIRKIGIIYGAAHGDGIRGLVEGLGFEEVERIELSTF